VTRNREETRDYSLGRDHNHVSDSKQLTRVKKNINSLKREGGELSEGGHP